MGIGDRGVSELRRGAIILIAALALVTWKAAAAAEPALLRHVELQSEGATATLTLSLSAPVRAHVFRLHDPERVVIDLPHTRTDGRLPDAAAGGPVVAMRSGFTPQHALRLVLELRAPMRLQQQSIRSADWQLRLGLQAMALAAGPAREYPRCARGGRCRARGPRRACGEQDRAGERSRSSCGRPCGTRAECCRAAGRDCGRCRPWR